MKLRAVLPPALAVAIIAGAAATAGHSAAAAPSLPSVSAAQLLASIAAAQPPGITGTVVEKASLGLPKLPSGAATGGGPDSAPSGLEGLLTGTHDLRVWDGGNGRVRVQILDEVDETDVVSDGTNGWLYTYSTNTAVHLRLPADGSTPAPTTLTDPTQLAQQLLNAIEPSTQVSVSGTARVAGRSAYTLQLRPRTDATTIGLVTVDVDANTRTPLQVKVFARDASSPAISVGFSSVSFGRVPAARFEFTPPPGAKVSELAAPVAASGETHASPSAPTGAAPGAAARLIGSGWTSVLDMPGSASSGGSAGPTPLPIPRLLGSIGTPVQGGLLVHTTLVNLLVGYDGRVLAGAVPASTLESIAGTSASTG